MEHSAEILERVAAVYAGCRSYRDSGTCTSVILSGPRSTESRHTTALDFETAFVRPDLFRFEYRERAVGPPSEWQRYVVWQVGGAIRSWWTLDRRVETFDDLGGALAGPTGVSHGTAYLVPPLLVPQLAREVFPRRFAGVRHVGDEALDGVECHRLQAFDADECSRRTFWIDARTNVLLRVDGDEEYTAERLRRQHERVRELRERAMQDPRAAQVAEMMDQKGPASGEFRVERTIRYRPQLDVELERDAFVFEPPAA